MTILLKMKSYNSVSPMSGQISQSLFSTILIWLSFVPCSVEKEARRKSGISGQEFSSAANPINTERNPESHRSETLQIEENSATSQAQTLKGNLQVVMHLRWPEEPNTPLSVSVKFAGNCVCLYLWSYFNFSCLGLCKQPALNKGNTK